MKLKKGDEVIVTVGKDRGKRAKIERILPEKPAVMLPGLNMFKRHVKKRGDKNPGGIQSFNRALPISNVALICPKCGKQTRVGYRIIKDGKERVCKKCGNAV